jgi:dipeptidase D
VKRVDAVHAELFGKPMVVKAIHAGLECGLIGEKYPGLEMASIGPSMWDVHTPDEQVSIPSVGRFYRFLTAVLERL